MKQLHKYLWALAGTLSTDTALQIQKDQFVRGMGVPEAVDEQTIRPKSNGRVHVSMLETLVTSSSLTEEGLPQLLQYCNRLEVNRFW